ncbi:MAG: NTP transferase domain-containing protein, partial [Deltaproteobacteria bacterium]|nr:NTP transferase domain-containing protein [Deltaproteobacteria bacterium]
TQEVCASSCERVAVVLGSGSGSISAALEGLPVATLPNVLWTAGKSAAIRCAVAWALRSGADGLLFVHGDQARVDRAHVDSLLSAFCETRGPVGSEVHGEVAVPAVFGIESFARLGQLTGNRDTHEILRTTPIVKAIPWPEGAIERAIDSAIDSALGDIRARIRGRSRATTISDLPTDPAVSAPFCP